MFDHESYDAHEGIHLFEDEASGLRAIIAIHSTQLGPSAGGCRMWNYGSGEAMLRDALRLSHGMSYKSAMAGLELGGGKSVIWGDPRTDKTPELFRAFGRAIESLQGRYYTAEDVGISPADMEFIAEETRYVAGRETGEAASGDPSPVTANGIFRGIKACARRVFDTDSVEGLTVALQGVGHVGGHLARLLSTDGANLVISDVNAEALEAVRDVTGAKTVAPDEIASVEADIFSPNALGGVVTNDMLKGLKAKIIAGGANNQLVTRDMGARLVEAGVLYAPDYIINGGGIINVASEISGTYSRDWVDGKLDELIETLGAVLDRALEAGRPTSDVADEMARERIAKGRRSSSQKTREAAAG